jgi:hypothetical protein
MHRRIMLSRSYQVSSSEEGSFPRQRLNAETLRDAILAVSGGLDRSPAGPHPFAPRKTWDYNQASPFYAVYPSNRRSVYLMQQRLQKHPYLSIFDGPDPNSSTAARAVTTTSIQALFLMNSPFVREQAEKFAARIRREAKDQGARIDLAYRLALGRPATSKEMAEAESFIGCHRDDRWISFCRVLFCSNEFLYVD